MARNPSHKVYERRWKEHARQLERACAKPSALLALRELAAAFEAHLCDQANEHGVKVEELCPCATTALVRAKALLAELDHA